ncbi:MAG: PIN domain-containing protein [Cellvibrionaceae bacterium]
MTVLVDTSVWVDHLRSRDERLAQLLTDGLVCMHPMIIGELACGHLQNREQLQILWQNLPKSTEASHHEALHLLESHQLMGKGIGYVDLHLLASCLLTGDTRLWTRDRRLARIAETLDIDFPVQKPRM